jgi:acrylyl-CoA reductase (NADPH)
VSRFRALRVSGTGAPAIVETVEGWPEAAGRVVVGVACSALSRTDAIAINGVISVLPGTQLGQDLAGTVITSDHPRWRRGDAVIATGRRSTPEFIGGLAEQASVEGDDLISLPPDFTPAEAMAVGTPGLAAALAVELLEGLAVTPERGPVFVTGSSGGLGSLAVALLASVGYRVSAITSRPAHQDYLLSLGAFEVISVPNSSTRNGKSPCWAGGIDVIGGALLATLLAETRPMGAVVSCGALAGDIPNLSLAPFTNDGVCLLGCDAVGLGRAARSDLWERLARDLDRGKLAHLFTWVALDAAVWAASELLAGRVRGRIVVQVADGPVRDPRAGCAEGQ